MRYVAPAVMWRQLYNSKPAHDLCSTGDHITSRYYLGSAALDLHKIASGGLKIVI